MEELMRWELTLELSDLWSQTSNVMPCDLLFTL
jgi:hypothetical protein